MYIVFLLFSILLELLSPSSIKIDGEVLEHSFWIAVACRFAITMAVHGVLNLFKDLYDFIVWVCETYKKYNLGRKGGLSA